MKTTLKEAVSEILGTEVSTKQAQQFAKTNYLDLVRFIHHEKKIDDLKTELKKARGIKHKSILGLRTYKN